MKNLKVFALLILLGSMFASCLIVPYRSGYGHRGGYYQGGGRYGGGGYHHHHHGGGRGGYGYGGGYRGHR